MPIIGIFNDVFGNLGTCLGMRCDIVLFAASPVDNEVRRTVGQLVADLYGLDIAPNTRY